MSEFAVSLGKGQEVTPGAPEDVKSEGMKDRERIIGWAILLISITLCFVSLSLKPPHSDESGNGFFVNQIWDTGFYLYDPSNYHGPLLFYLFQISEKIFGFGIGSFRAVTALFSVLSVWLIIRNRDLLGHYASFFAAFALALSPGMTFFGRSAIHESVFVFFQILLVTGLLKAGESAGRQGVIWSFAGLLGCMLLKETFVILLLSLFVAWIWTFSLPRIVGVSTAGKRTTQNKRSKVRKPSPGGKGIREDRPPVSGLNAMELPPALPLRELDRSLLLKMSFLCVFLWLAFFTGFFHHWRGAADFFTALMPWLKTGVGGSGHDKPFAYWLRLMGRYEWAAALGFAGAFIGLIGRSWKMRFFSALAIVNWLVYSFISYKTPWCIISILWPFVVVAGLWAEAFFAGRRGRLLWVTLCAGAFIVGQSAVANIRLNFFHYTDPSEPYVYVQTKNDVKLIEDIIGKKISSSPDARNMRVQINLKDSWPFPWLFSRFPYVGFGDYRKAFAEKADVVFAELSHEDKDPDGLYWKRVIDVRDARAPIAVYLKKSVFQGIDLPGFGPSQSPGDRT